MVDKKPTKKPHKSRKKPTTSKSSTPKKKTTSRTKKTPPKKADKPKAKVTLPYKPKMGAKLDTGITKFDVMIILVGLRKQIKQRLKDDAITVAEACEVSSYLFRRLGKKSNHQVFRTFCFAQSKSFLDLIPLISNWIRTTEGGSDMAGKIKLGITLPEIMGMLPELVTEAWGAYADDKQITADEGVIFAAVVMEQMAEAADHPEVKAFFASQGLALRDLAPLLVGSEEEEPVEEEGDGS